MYVMLAGSELVRLQIRSFHYENIFDMHIFKRFIFYVYVCVCMYIVYVCIYVVCMYVSICTMCIGAYRSQKRASGPLELEL